MKRIHRTHRGVVMVLIAAIAAVSIAACGGSSTTTATTAGKSASATTASSSRTKLAACLKKQGVTLPSGGGFHRPSGTGTTPTGAPPSGGTAGGGAPTGTTPTGGAPGGGFAGGAAGGFGTGTSSKLQKALKACGANFGGGRAAGGFAGGARPKISTKVLDSYVTCIRKNGDSSMPEPYATSKTTPFPASAETSTAFKKANTRCQSIVTSAFRQGAGTPTATTSSATSTA